MVPIYSASNFLQLYYYHHSVYYAVIADCYEAFAISAFFNLMCSYIAPTLHDQKQFFRQLKPIQPWVWPVNWFKKGCGGDRGPWRTPNSGLTWFNIIWIGVYHYCFIRVAMTIVAVVTQHFKRYCESSLSPYYSHVWVRRSASLQMSTFAFPHATSDPANNTRRDRSSPLSVLPFSLPCTASFSSTFSSRMT